MSFDIVGGTSPVLEIPVLPYVGDPAALTEGDAELAQALALLNAAPGEEGAILEPDAAAESDLAADGEAPDVQGATAALQPEPHAGLTEDQAAAAALGLVLGDVDEPAPLGTFYYDDQLDPGTGGGYVEVTEPPFYAPDGFYGEDLYAVEFVHDAATGLLTIYLHFSTDPLDFAAPGESTVSYSPLATDGLAMTPEVGLVSPVEAGNPGSRCTVTITRTTTQNSGSYTVNFNTGVLNGSRTSPSTSTTTTTSVMVEGTLVNGRCVLRTTR